MKKLLLLFLIFGIVSSCTVANLPSKNIPNQLQKDSQNGMIIGAIAIEDSPRTIYNGYYFFYTDTESSQLDSPKNNHIKIIPSQTVYLHFKPDFFEDGKAIYYFNIIKPKGKYRFYAKRIILNTVSYTRSETEEINIPFEVENGLTKYIGELYFRSDKSYQINNKSERDLKKLNQMFPLLEIQK